MYHQLQQSGQLENHLKNMAQRIQDEYVSGIQSGMNPFEAQSEAKKNNFSLFAEEDQHALGENPERLRDPANLSPLGCRRSVRCGTGHARIMALHPARSRKRTF